MPTCSGVGRQCAQIHAALYQSYIPTPVESAPRVARMRTTVRHVTRFTYDTPITESVMEARMQPRSDGCSGALHFALTITPRARVISYRDHDGNTVHHFDIPATIRGWR